MGHEEESVFIQNETEANKVIATTLLASALVYFFFIVLFVTGVYYEDSKTEVYVLLINIFLIGFALIFCFRSGFKGKMVRNILMSVMIVGYAFMDAVFSYYVSLLIVVPVVLSTKYFSKRYTISIFIITEICFLISAIWGAFSTIVDLNCVELTPGTVIDVGEETWLVDIVQNIEYDRVQLARNILCYSYGIKFLFALVVAIVCVQITKQGKKMVHRQQELTERTAMVKAELSVAANIQAEMVPTDFSIFEDRKEFDLYASMTPALEVGGDFYDFFLVDDDHLALVIADVSDKGIPAAMFMVNSKNIIANNAMQGKSPHEVLKDSNNTICRQNSEDLFVTVWLGILQISTGVLKAANAGHERPILKNKSDEFSIFNDRDMHGFPLGGFEDSDYEEYEIHLSAGDKLFLYTDGVPEATNSEDHLFEIDRALKSLNKNPLASPKQLLGQIQESVDDFVKEAGQFDDLTMIAFEYKGTVS